MFTLMSVLFLPTDFSLGYSCYFQTPISQGHCIPQSGVRGKKTGVPRLKKTQLSLPLTSNLSPSNESAEYTLASLNPAVTHFSCPLPAILFSESSG